MNTPFGWPSPVSSARRGPADASPNSSGYFHDPAVGGRALATHGVVVAHLPGPTCATTLTHSNVSCVKKVTQFDLESDSR